MFTPMFLYVGSARVVLEYPSGSINGTLVHNNKFLPVAETLAEAKGVFPNNFGSKL